MVVLPAASLAPFDRFTLHNSPYPAHERGCAVDCYPADAVAAHPGGRTPAPSPVAGEVRTVRTVAGPSRPYADAEDHLVLVDVDGPDPLAGLVARLLHAEPSVEPGDRLAVGDTFGTLVRSGYYARWVPDHVHLGFREPDADLQRATGSLPLEVGVDVEPLEWDGTGTVVETGPAYVGLDAPANPAPGERWVGVAAGTPAGPAVLDGGLPHYDGGGLLAGGTGPLDGREGSVDAGDDTLDGRSGPVTLAGQQVGTADGRRVVWDDVTVRANGQPVTGLSLYCARDDFGAKLVGEDLDLAVGDDVTVSVQQPNAG